MTGLITAVVLFSCQREDTCLEDTRALVNINLYRLVDGEPEDTTITLSVNLLPAADTVPYDSVTRKALSLPLSNLAESSGFVFTFYIPVIDSIPDTLKLFTRSVTRMELDTLWEGDTFSLSPHMLTDTVWRDTIVQVQKVSYTVLNDTLYVHFGRKLQMISEACGFTYYYTLETIEHTRHVITNIIISDAEITTRDDENVKILF